MNQRAEILQHIELLIGSIGVILSLFFAIYLYVNRKKLHKANIFLAIYLLAFSLRIGKSLFYNYFPIDATIRTAFLSVLLTIGPSIWFYTRFLYQSDYNVKKQIIFLHYVPFIVVAMLCWVIPNDGSTFARIFYNSLIFHIVIYTVYSLNWILKQPTTQLSNEKQKVRSWLIYFVLITLFLMCVYFLTHVRVIPYYLGTAFLFSVVVILFLMKALNNPSLFKKQNEKYSNSNLKDDDVNAYMDTLNSLMEKERLYLNPELTLTMLSKKIGITSKLLSQVINQSQNCNYSQYIANYRIEEAKRLLSSNEFKNHKIAAIAYDSGFNSLSSFNAAFKKLTEMTAIQYRQLHTS